MLAKAQFAQELKLRGASDQMVDVVEGARAQAPAEAKSRRPLPSWVITIGSLVVLLGAWEILGRDINPVFGSYPSAIAEAFWQLARTGKLWTALLDSLRPFLLGYGLAIVVGIPIGLVTGRLSWDDAVREGRLSASGTRTGEVRGLLPLT